MKIKVMKDEQFIHLNLGDEIGLHPILSFPECESLINNSYGCVSDIAYTIKEMGNKLIIFYEDRCTWKANFNVKRFFEVCLKIPVVKINNYSYKEYEMDTDSFQRYPDYSFPEYTVMQIVKHRNFSKSAIIPLKNAFRLPKPYFLQLKRKINQLIDHAVIYPDSYSRDELSFSFNGRGIIDGCGYNGGLIFHGKRDGYGSGSAPTFSVCINPTDGYSIHT